MSADTLAPTGSNLDVTYTGHPVGGWNDNSEYHWYSSLIGAAAGGLFGPSLPATFLLTYSAPTAAPGTADHINLRLTDSVDAATATSNYYLRFHGKYEDWHRSSQMDHPVAYVSGTTNPDWTYFNKYQNDTDVAQTVHITITEQLQKTKSGTIASEVATQATNPAGFLAFKVNESITSTTQVTSSITQTIDVTIPPHKTVKVYIAMVWSDLAGTCSTWGLHGYSGDVNWTGIRVPNSNGQVTVAVALDQQ